MSLDVRERVEGYDVAAKTVAAPAHLPNVTTKPKAAKQLGIDGNAPVLTDKGPVPAHTLCVGDYVLTRDNGFCRIKEISVDQDPGPLVEISPQMFGIAGATGSVAVAAHHPVLLRDSRAALLFGAYEICACAKHIAQFGHSEPSAAPHATLTVQVTLAHSEFILCGGLWVATVSNTDTARQVLKRDEVKLLIDI